MADARLPVDSSVAPVGGAGADSDAARFRAAAPAAAGALAIVVALVTGSLMTDGGSTPVKEPAASPEAPAVAAAPDTSGPQASAPEPGTSIPGVAFDQAPGAAVQPGGIEIVVKFKNDAAVKDIIDSFWKNQDAARTKFEAFKAGKPQFAGLKLDRVTYSNELVLVDSQKQGLQAMRDIAAKLKTHPDISYADPNMTAHTGSN